MKMGFRFGVGDNCPRINAELHSTIVLKMSFPYLVVLYHSFSLGYLTLLCLLPSRTRYLIGSLMTNSVP